MVVITAAVMVGLLAGRVITPRRRGVRVALAWWPLLPTGTGAQVVAERVEGTAALVAVLVGYGCLMAFAAANLHLTGMGVVVVGLGLNVVPIVANGATPVRASALVEAGLVDPEEVDGVELRGSRHVEDDGDVLAELGDIVPLPAADRVVSFGDLVLAVGTADVVAHLSRRRRTGSRGRTTPSSTPSFAPRQAGVDAAGLPSSRRTSPVHDWGDAPRPVPSSGSQHSAKPEATAPATVAGPTGAPARASR